MGDPWTKDLNSRFEEALARYDLDTPDRWQNVARAVGGGMTADDVRRHYEELERDLHHIERTGRTRHDGGSGNSRGESSRGSSSSKEQRPGRLRIQ
ncbi:unnamed protein product [Alopecurus aequalis]